MKAGRKWWTGQWAFAFTAAACILVNQAGGVAMTVQLELRSEIACPHCGHRKVEDMPTDACRFFYECEACGTILRPKAGDCCVFCSYGSVPCPPMQVDRQGGRPRCCP